MNWYAIGLVAPAAHSRRCIQYFSAVEQTPREGRRGEASAIMIDVARRLERSGADFFLNS